MQESQIELSQWFDQATHPEAVEMMQEESFVPFGTALWSV